MTQVLFHLAFPIADIAETKAFYVDGLGCEVGRESANSVILNLYGHQLVAHITHEPLTPQRGIYPRHFGLVFTNEADWQALLERAQRQDLSFHQTARVRFEGSQLEHRTFFLADPAHNLLEFKVYHHASAIFGDRDHGLVGDAEEVASPALVMQEPS